MNEDITFLRTNANGFENAERRLLDDGWKAKKYTRTTNNAIKTSYLVYLAQERAKELQRFLTPAEIDALKPEVSQLKNTEMYVRPRAAAAAAAAMNDYNEENLQSSIDEIDRLVVP